MLDSGLLQESITELKKLIRFSGAHAPVCRIVLSIAYNRVGEHQQGIQVLNECIKLNPEYPDSYQARGQALLLQEKYAEALQDFQRFTTLMPLNGMGFLGVGDSHKALKQWQAAINSYSKALSLFPADASACVLQATLKRGLCYYHLQVYDHSINDFQAVVRQDVTSIKAHFYIGKILSKRYLQETASQCLGAQKEISQKSLQQL